MWAQPLRDHSNWQWHPDEVFVKINRETEYLWQVVDHEGEVLKSTLQSAGTARIRKS
ncbi:MAG: DDE-type integrase/transposase/recombinase [Rhizobiaceae bacterium]